MKEAFTIKEVTIYIKTHCPFSKKTMELLKSKNIDFTAIDVLEDEKSFEKIKEETGVKTVPQIFIDGEFIGGCDDIHTLEETQQLNEKLGI